MNVLCSFYVVHEPHVQLRLRYGGATLVEDALPLAVVQAYRTAWGGQGIADAKHDNIRHRCRVFKEKCEHVAQHANMVVWPLACAHAVFHIAYVMLRCASLFAGQCWYRSRTSEFQRQFSYTYPVVDFEFWVKYGSWSQCPACGSYHFNDRYFKQFVYQAQGISLGHSLHSLLFRKC